MYDIYLLTYLLTYFQETRWYMAPVTYRTSNQNSAQRVTGIGYIKFVYCAETWPITEVNRKRLEGFHHNCLRRIMNISWKDKVTNESVRRTTDQSLLECTLQKEDLDGLVVCSYGKCQSR